MINKIQKLNVGIQIRASIWRKFKNHCKKNSLKLSSMVEQLLTEYLKRESER